MCAGRRLHAAIESHLQMMKKYFCISIFLLTTLLVTDVAFAQVTDRDSIAVPVRKKRPKPIKQEVSFGLRMNTDGWSLFMDRGKVKNTDRTTDYYYDLNFWQVEFSEKKHPMEIKRSNTISSAVEAAKPFVYGKISNFYTLNIGYGKRKLIAGKSFINNDVEPRAMSIHWVYLGALSIGLEKPYYIDAYVNQNGSLVQKTISYNDDTKEDFLAQQFIVGSSGFGQGLGETKIVPGIQVKTGLHFDFAPTKTSKLAVETGISANMYSRAIQLMANQNAVPYFVNAYMSFQVGKRWAQKK